MRYYFLFKFLMARFYDALSGKVVEMEDWLDKTGSRARGRAARHAETSSAQSGKSPNRPGLGTAYTIGSYRSYNPKGTPTKVFNILDQGDNVDLLSPGVE